jgi:hypothetical protein
MEGINKPILPEFAIEEVRGRGNWSKEYKPIHK